MTRLPLVIATLPSGLLIHLFEDTQGGGFFDTQGTDPLLPGRTRDVRDNAVPASSSVAIKVLTRLAALDDSGRFETAARRALASLTRLALKLDTPTDSHSPAARHCPRPSTNASGQNTSGMPSPITRTIAGAPVSPLSS